MNGNRISSTPTIVAIGEERDDIKSQTVSRNGSQLHVIFCSDFREPRDPDNKPSQRIFYEGFTKWLRQVNFTEGKSAGDLKTISGGYYWNSKRKTVEFPFGSAPQQDGQAITLFDAGWEPTETNERSINEKKYDSGWTLIIDQPYTSYPSSGDKFQIIEIPIQVSLDLTQRPESPSTILRFEDQTDLHAPQLRYSVPLPASYEAVHFMEIEEVGVPFTDAAQEGAGTLSDVTTYQLTTEANGSIVKVREHEIPVTEIEKQAAQQRALVVYPTFGGRLSHTFVHEAADEATANPRFVIVEHYRMASYFGNYGAGRTLKTFTLWPGEETVLYIRNWQRTEESRKRASSIFDSFTQEAGIEFENSIELENKYKDSYQSTKEWKAKGGAGLNLGIIKIGGGGGGGGTSKKGREQLRSTVSKVAIQHAAKASAQRDIRISSELQISETTELETIIERQVKNINLSRVLNLVCRELNQEFTTYLTLTDISVAFVNDRHVFDEVPLYDLDRLLNKYVATDWVGNPPTDVAVSPHMYMKQFILEQISTVYDYQGESKQFLEEATEPSGETYVRVRRRNHPDAANPFYPNENVPVDGIIMALNRHTVRTDGVIFDALLGHGVALDSYALGVQQETLLEKQLSNKKTELALSLIDSASSKKVDAFKSLFGDSTKEIIEEILHRLLTEERA